MDVVRQGVRKKKAIRRAIILAVLVIVAGGVTFGVSRLQPALPSVEAGSVYPDTVKRGPMVRQVHGNGSLVPEDVLWISARTEGRVDKIAVRPGTVVKAGDVIMELSNPSLVEAVTSASWDLKQAEAVLDDLTVTLQNTKIDKQTAAAQVTSDYQQAKIKAERDKELAGAGLIPIVDYKLSAAAADQLELRNNLEKQRLGVVEHSTQTQIAAQKVRIEQLRAMYELKKQQVDQLVIRAGVAGMLQQLGNAVAGSGAPALEVGQNVAAGSILARIAQQDKLMAQIRITETEAKDITLGQPAEIDTHNGVVAGKVRRIDPAAVNGTVLVDVGLTGALPPGARPDLSVDGTVELERLNDVVYIGRPATGAPNATITLFRLDPDGKTATRTSVKLGRASVNTIEVVDGLKVGDKVILSDMSSMDSHDRVRLN